MSRMNPTIPILIVLLVAGVVAAAQSPSDQLRQRTGFALPPVQEGPAAFSLPPGITLTGVLSANDAVAIALWNNTALQSDLANLEVSRADLVEAGQFRNPNFSVLFPVGPKPFELLVAWPIEELWQRKPRIRSAQSNLEAVSTGLVQNGLDLIRNVRVAHTDLWFAEARSRIFQESAELRARIATFTERRRDAGDATGLDVSLAQSDAQYAAESARIAVADIEIARSRLRHLLGMKLGEPLLSAGSERTQRAALPRLEDLMETAVSSRPDLRAAELFVNARAEKAKWERSQVLALMAPTVSVKEIGSEGVRTGPGLNMEIPILSRNQGRISKADAEVVLAGRQYASLRDRIEQEVVESREQVLQALSSQERLAQQVRPPVEQSIRLSERAYESGDVTLLNVLEATRQRYDLDLREAEMYAASERARANLERAIGRSL
jgi:cobalt-zinc-cadmium efflux system outer membrane protein